MKVWFNSGHKDTKRTQPRGLVVITGVGWNGRGFQRAWATPGVWPYRGLALEMHLKSLCGGSVLLRDEFLADLADRCKTKGVVMVKQDEHAHLVKCKAVCANLHQSVQILKQCRNKSERRAYNTVSLAVSCGCTGRAGRTCGTLPPMPSVSQLHSHGPFVTARSLSVLLSAIHDCRRWYRTHP